MNKNNEIKNNEINKKNWVCIHIQYFHEMLMFD